MVDDHGRVGIGAGTPTFPAAASDTANQVRIPDRGSVLIGGFSQGTSFGFALSDDVTDILGSLAQVGGQTSVDELTIFDDQGSRFRDVFLRFTAESAGLPEFIVAFMPDWDEYRYR